MVKAAQPSDGNAGFLASPEDSLFRSSFVYPSGKDESNQMFEGMGGPLCPGAEVESRSLADYGYAFSTPHSNQFSPNYNHLMNPTPMRDTLGSANSFHLRSPPPITSTNENSSASGRSRTESLTESDVSSLLSSTLSGRDTGGTSSPSSAKSKKKKQKSLKRGSVIDRFFSSRKSASEKSKSSGEKLPPKNSADDGIENIGLKLALPSTIGIMTGKEPPPSPLSVAQRKTRDQEKKLAETENKDFPRLSCFSEETVLTDNTDTSKKHDGSIMNRMSFIEKNTSTAFSETSSSNGSYLMGSCELEPSQHQIQIPGPDQFLMHARICTLMENHSNMMLLAKNDQEMFDFGVLAGQSRFELEGMYTQIVNRLNLQTGAMSLEAGGGPAWGQGGYMQPHPSILKSLLECADDLVVEGYFSAGESTNESMQLVGRGIEATVFSSQRHRQFIVCFRGSHAQQSKPFSKKKSGSVQECVLRPTQPVSIIKAFHDGCFSNDLENRIFALLDRLATDHPFCDVVMTGHSFGGGLATVASVRYASQYQMMKVSCHAFGSPKVGGKAFRRLAHSIPNLQVVRVENGEDPYVFLPESGKLKHVGHSIVITSDFSEPVTSEMVLGPSVPKCSAVAYRFDAQRPDRNNFWNTPVVGGKTKKMRRDREIRAYVTSIENFTHLGQPWVTKFASESGDGINVTHGSDSEERGVV